jgi:hypothetical protein
MVVFRSLRWLSARLSVESSVVSSANGGSDRTVRYRRSSLLFALAELALLVGAFLHYARHATDLEQRQSFARELRQELHGGLY